MNRRIPQTLTDYVLIAINPTLIGLLVGSLMFFLIEVFYQGEYTLRLQFISAMYVMGVVSIARISIEEGRGYASMYALPLAIVVAIAMARFVSFSGPFAAFSTPISWGLIALGWWSADKLTWDCTVITDAPDTSGQGLLQAVGLDGSAPQPVRAGAAPEEDASFSASIASAPEPLRNVAKWFERRRRAPHTPGVWVVYYSLAALPLFGLGQWFIPAANQASRSFAFGCLVLYVACGLSLLLTTSFLGLRRYLGQKGIYVPLDITATWLMVGGVMIVALLIVAAILPRPNAGGRAAPIAYSPIQTPSQYGVGNDGPQDRSGQRSGPQAKDGKLQGQSPSKDQSNSSSGQDGKSGTNSQPGSKQSGGKSSNQQTSDKQSPNSSDKSDKSNPSDPGSKSNDAKSGERGSDSKSQPQNSQPDSQKSQNQNNSSGDNSTPPQQPPANQPPPSSSQTPPSSYQPNQSPPPQPPSQSPPSQSPSQQQTSPSSSSPPNQSQPAPQSRPAASPMNVLSSVGSLLKWVLYAVIACVAAYFAWKFRERIAASWQQFLNELRAWWERLFGKKMAATAAAQAAAAATAPPPRPFADFADPFATGQAARWTPAEVVTYSFSAFEAWGREHGCPRAVDQTPAEFAQFVATHEPSVTRDARSLADLYSQVAYAKTQPATSSLEPLRRLWQQLRSQVAVA